MRTLAQYKKMKISESSPWNENAKIKNKFKTQSQKKIKHSHYWCWFGKHFKWPGALTEEKAKNEIKTKTKKPQGSWDYSHK